MNSNTVYLLGAGVNKNLRPEFNQPLPPLANDFFQYLISELENKNTKLGGYTNSYERIFSYIQQYWKLTKTDLLKVPFNLEELFTLIDAQRKEQSNDALDILLDELTIAIGDIFSFHEYYGSIRESPFEEFARRIYGEKSNVITLNYDCILEKAIENISGNGPYQKTRCAYNWNRALAYGIQFDKLTLQGSHWAGGRNVSAKKFYADPQNKFYDWSILKLHGSINWFHCIPYTSEPNGSGGVYYSKIVLPSSLRNKLILHNGDWEYSHMPLYRGQYIAKPLIIPPVLYKQDLYKQDEMQKNVFATIQKNAEKALSHCQRLVMIGYSLPITDFPVRKLLLESFENHAIRDLIVVNPDTSVVSKIKGLLHHKGPITVYSDLTEYLKHEKRSS
jgi:hypothetical protein